MCLGLLSHRRGCRSKSSVPAYFLYHDVTFRKWGFPNLGVPRRLATVQCMGATLTTIKASTKVVRSRKDLGAQMKIEAKRRGSSTNSCHLIVGHKNNSITIVSWSQTFAFRTRVWLCKSTIRSTWWWACNRTSTMLGYRSMMVGNVELAHKTFEVDWAASVTWVSCNCDTFTVIPFSIPLLHSIAPFHIPVQRLEMPVVVHVTSKT